jgi:hypothetical protein
MTKCSDCEHSSICEGDDLVRCTEVELPTEKVDLPCRLGQRVWFIKDKSKKEIIETSVEKIILKSGGWYIKLACNSMYETSCRSIGKTVFFSESSAKKTLTYDLR